MLQVNYLSLKQFKPNTKIIFFLDYEEKPQVVQKVNYFTNNKWVKLDVCENEEGDLTVNQTEITQFKKRGGKSTKKLLEDDIAVSAPLEAYVDDDGDLDYIPRKKPAVNEDEDLSPGYYLISCLLK